MKIATLLGLATLALAGSPIGLAASADAAAPLTLAGTGPYYTLSLNMAARQTAGRLDLSDLRVRNAAGDVMAFAWAEVPAPVADPQRVPARLYKVPLPPADAASSIEGRPRQAWIVDTRDARLDLMQLELDLDHGTQGAYTLRIEASDDLQHWRTVQEDAQLVQLQPLPQVGAAAALATQAGREQLKSNPIDLDAAPARYLRLTTAPRSAVPPLVAATIARAPHRPAPPPLEWSAAIAATRCDADSCEYALPRNVPVDAVQIAPADVDTIGQVMVSGRVDAARPLPRHSLLRGSLHALRLKADRSAERAGPAWDNVAEANVYWLTQPAGAPDLRSPPLRLGGGSWSALRLETYGPISQLGHAAPAIRIGVRPRQLVFVARGAGPFVLARAAAAEQTAPMSLAALMPARGADAPLPEATATVAAPVAASAASLPAVNALPASAPTSSDSPWLWAALLAGLALMAAMAWSLLRKPAAADG
jgi:hypothetical protein